MAISQSFCSSVSSNEWGNGSAKTKLIASELHFDMKSFWVKRFPCHFREQIIVLVICHWRIRQSRRPRSRRNRRRVVTMKGCQAI